MKKKGIVLAMSLAVSFLIAGTVWAGGQSESSAATHPKTLKLGVLLPLTGTFAGVAETQRDGILLAVDQANAAGGLTMPWGKVKVTAQVADDQAKLDVGVRKFKYLVDQGAQAVVGQTYAPLAFAINEEVKKSPIPYFPVCVMSKEGFQKGKLAYSTYATAFSPWTVGYMDGTAAINVLHKKRIFFLARSDSWGWGIRDGVEAAAKKYGAKIVGYAEAPLGTTDFTTILQKVLAAKPDVFISAQFGGDAVALLKQAYQMGLYSKMTMFNAWITNVVAKGIPAQALTGLYAMDYYYWNMKGFSDSSTAERSAQFDKAYEAKYGTPPDSYAAIAYVATEELFRGIQTAGSFKADAVSKALSAHPKFDSVKGPATWREDHIPVYKYAGFLVEGKAPSQQSTSWDLFKVVGTAGGSDVLPTLASEGY